MSVQSKMPCWEIIQCKKKEACLFANNDKKSCWEMVGSDDACSIHVCIDCLVYLAKHEYSPLTKETFYYIMKKRMNITKNIPKYKGPISRTLSDSPTQTKDTLKNNLSLQRNKVPRQNQEQAL